MWYSALHMHTLTYIQPATRALRKGALGIWTRIRCIFFHSGNYNSGLTTLFDGDIVMRDVRGDTGWRTCSW